MKVLVCGGRDFEDFDLLEAELDKLASSEIIEMVIQGGARGADTMAAQWCSDKRIPCLEVPADWPKHGRRAGYLRNVHMLTFEPDVVLAMPGGKGTAMMCDIAEKAGVSVIKREKADANNSCS